MPTNGRLHQLSAALHETGGKPSLEACGHERARRPAGSSLWLLDDLPTRLGRNCPARWDPSRSPGGPGVAAGECHEKVFRRGPAVLDRLDLDLRPGSVTLVAGANGSGKSTLLRIVADPSIADRHEVRVMLAAPLRAGALLDELKLRVTFPLPVIVTTPATTAALRLVVIPDGPVNDTVPVFE